MGKISDFMATEAARIRKADRERITAHCRTCGKGLTGRNGYDCGGGCATVTTYRDEWRVWRSWYDFEERRDPIAVCTSEDAARAVQRLRKGSWRSLERAYGHRPRLACDDKPPMTDADVEAWYAEVFEQMDDAAKRGYIDAGRVDGRCPYCLTRYCREDCRYDRRERA